jgi:hypothetical protein
MTDLPGQGELPFIGAKRCEKLKWKGRNEFGFRHIES